MDKSAVADVLESIATLLELQGENPFKVRAYANGARAVSGLEEDLATLVAENRLEKVKGIGDALAKKVGELVKTGRLEYYEELKKNTEPGLLAIMEVPGLGPKKIKALHDELGVRSVEELEAACHRHDVAKLSGFGAKSEQKILQGIEQRRSYSALHRQADVLPLALAMIERLRAHPGVIRCSVAGSMRRGKDITKDLDLLASSSKPDAVMTFFAALPEVERVTSHGSTKSSVLLKGGVTCDLRVVPDRDYPCALHHFTGSKEHNVAMRQRAISQGKKLSEWGLFHIGSPGKGKISDEEDAAIQEAHRIACASEEDIFSHLGLAFIPPELRENLGEIEAAEKGAIPRLVEWTDLRGTFHCHTTASDGRSTLGEMAEAARALGLEYLGIADHSKSSFQANGLSEDRLARQIEEIAKLNRTFDDGFQLFAGSEVDILKDGRLDFDDSVLATLDYAVASVHNVFTLDEDAMTKRICRALENEHVTILGHVTGRLLLQREGYAVNLDKVIDCAAATGTWIEMNADGWRLDMDWRWWRKARDKGVKCVVNPDAHHVSGFGCLRHGVTMARKGWLRKEDVVNTRPLEAIANLLKTG
jgi:DNA polymerase (family 10)